MKRNLCGGASTNIELDAGRGLQATLERFDIKTWDLLLVGDGSGSGWNIGCGHAVILIDKISMLRKLLCGFWNHGTVGVGELMGYLHALMWFEAHLGEKRRLAKNGPVEVHIICDNETVVKQGNREMGRKVLAPLWAAIDTEARRGYQLCWHWARRDSTDLNHFVDGISRLMRETGQEIETNKDQIYFCNPS